MNLHVEDSVHYNHTSDRESEWLWSFPQGGGYYHLKANQQTFYISGYHTLHCLQRMFQATEEHRQHCLNLLRQAVLCHADLTLEFDDFTHRNFTINRFGVMHQCNDWNLVYNETSLNWINWINKYK